MNEQAQANSQGVIGFPSIRMPVPEKPEHAHARAA
jgi:hypothetical protein